jgi:carbon storage regulator
MDAERSHQMLVLTRKKSETIRIGENVFVKVIRTGRGSVKIGIEAPANVRVVRGELTPLGDHQAEQHAELYPFEMEDAEADATYSDQFPHPHLAGV